MPASQPLADRRIVVTRPRDQAQELTTALRALGAEVLLMPTIRIVAPSDPAPLRAAAREPDRFDWIVFTSVNGVASFWGALREVGLDTRSLAGVSLCAIGPATASGIELEGARADLVAAEHTAEGVVTALAEEAELAGARILLPQAEIAREVLATSLRAAGAEVVQVVAYRTLQNEEAGDALRRRIAEGSVDMVTFTSSSTVEQFVAMVGTEIGGVRVATIGPITSRTARSLGLPVDVEAANYSAQGLIAAISRYYEGAGRR